MCLPDMNRMASGQLLTDTEMVYHYSQCINEPCCANNSWSTERLQACCVLLLKSLQWHSTACPACDIIGVDDALQMAPHVEVGRSETGDHRSHTNGPFHPIHWPGQYLSKYHMTLQKEQAGAPLCSTDTDCRISNGTWSSSWGHPSPCFIHQTHSAEKGCRQCILLQYPFTEYFPMPVIQWHLEHAYVECIQELMIHPDHCLLWIVMVDQLPGSSSRGIILRNTEHLPRQHSCDFMTYQHLSYWAAYNLFLVDIPKKWMSCDLDAVVGHTSKRTDIKRLYCYVLPLCTAISYLSICWMSTAYSVPFSDT
jgi:hypothetical protein